MSVNKILKAKFPKFPKDLDDRNLEKLMDRLEKDLDAFRKSLSAIMAEYDKVIGTAIAVQEAVREKAMDKKLDPKQAKAALGLSAAYYEFYGVLSDL